MNPYEYDLIKKEAPFIKDPHRFVYWGEYRLRPVVATSPAQRKLFKENGWIWDRNTWRKPDAAEMQRIVFRNRAKYLSVAEYEEICNSELSHVDMAAKLGLSPSTVQVVRAIDEYEWPPK